MDEARDEVWGRIRRELAEALALDPDDPQIGLDSRLRVDLGLTSLKTVDLIVDLEEAFDIAIDDDDLAALDTVGDLVELVTRLATTSSAAR